MKRGRTELMGFPVIPHIFQTREEFETYVEDNLNAQGHEPVMGVVDQQGGHWLASRAAPGGDGYDFFFILIDGDTGYLHECNGEETGCSDTQCSLMREGFNSRDHQPSFPVLAWVKRGTL